VKKYKFKFLSESIVLEETGLPFINTIIILSVALFLGLFIAWSSQLTMEDGINVTGNVVEMESGTAKYQVNCYAETNNVLSIKEGSKVYIKIPGVTGGKSLNGYVAKIDNKPQFDSQNKVYYTVEVEFDNESVKETLLNGMEARVEIITGTRTLLQYLLGSLYDNNF
jgi:hypothetical protein